MDKDVLEELYRKYYTGTLLYCLSLCGQHHWAEDLVAEAFVKAYLSLPNDVPSFRYWLYRVCRNLWLDQVRRQKFLASPEALDRLPDPHTPESLYLQEERKRILWQAMDTLSPIDRELVTLHYFSGLPLNEIARLFGKSHAAVRQRLVRARTQLKQRMEEDYGQL